MAQTCTYSFTAPDGKKTVLTGQAAFKAWLVAGGLEYLRGAANDARSSAERDLQYPLAPAGERYEETGIKPRMMSPDEFLASVRPLDIDGASRDNIEDLKQHILSGRKLDPLHIRSDGKEDGRHRAVAAKELGIKLVPVIDERGGARASRARDVTETPEFKRWFGDSKVVGADGRPLVVYHGTNADFDAFKTGLNKASGERGIFFSPDPAVAAAYAGVDPEGNFNAPEIGSVMPVFLSLQNPLVVDFKGDRLGRVAAIKRARDGGHDGVILKNHYDAGGVQDQYVAFRPEQIKSATGNRGTFDPNDPDIRRSVERKLAGGEPIRLYHGSDVEIKQFDKTKARTAKHIYLTDQEETARKYGDKLMRVEAKPKNMLWLGPEDIGPRETKALRRVFADIGEDYGYEDFDTFLETVTGATGELYGANSRFQDALMDELFAAGYDAVAFPDPVPGGGWSMSYVFDDPALLTVRGDDGLSQGDAGRDIRRSAERDANFGGAYLDSTLRRAREQFRTSFGVDFGQRLTRDYEMVDVGTLEPSNDVDEGRVDELVVAMFNESPFDSKIPPIFIDSEGNILDGNHRVEAAKRAGLSSVPAFELYDADEGPQIIRSTERPWYYSQLARAIEGVPARLDNMAAPQWAQWLKANASKLGVKQDEITWSGIEDFLRLKGKEKVSKEEIGAYLAEGGVRVEEVTSPVGKSIGVSDFSQYTLPGGTAYREVLLTLPEPKRDLSPYEKDIVVRRKDTGVYDFEATYKTPGGRELRGVGDTEEEARAGVRSLLAMMQFTEPASYRSSHWDQKNVLAHVRLNDRVDAEGRRTLFVEELQSDAGADVRKKGFIDSYKLEDVQPTDGPLPDTFYYLKTPDNVFQIPKSRHASEQAAREYIVREKKINSGGVPRMPFIDDTTKWLNLALKRVIAMAATEGYDAVAFVNGEQSADRYDLSKQVDELVWSRSDDKYSLTARNRIDGVSQKIADDVPEGRLEDYVGKEIAKKIVAERGKRWTATYRGLDLKVGGEGMKAFYDKIVPQAASALVKKMGGEGMTKVTLPGADATPLDSYRVGDDGNGGYAVIWRATGEQVSSGHATRAEAKAEMVKIADSDPVIAPAFLITDEMRDKASGGMPLFSRERAIALPMAGDKVDGLVVRDGVPNYGSIEASLTNYEVLPGIREVPFDLFSGPDPQTARTRKLAADIEESGEIAPLIVVFDGEDHYILEGAHRFDALQHIGKKSFPAKVVVDKSGAGDARLSRERDPRTETPEFRAWFKRSKVTASGRAGGVPRVVYHGTGDDFSKFDPRMVDGFSAIAEGFYFTSSPYEAEQYGDVLMPVYLSLQNPAPKSVWDPMARAIARGETDSAEVRERLQSMGYDGIAGSDDMASELDTKVYVAFWPTQIKSAIGNDGSYDETDPSILSSAARNWESPGASKFDDVVYKMQNRQVDLLRVQQAIQEAGKQISEDANTYLREELFHGRAAKRTQDFTKRELEPLTEEMAKRGLTLEELDEYLHARHAPEANRLIAERNPDSPLLQDGGSGLDTALAQQYMSDLAADKKAHLEAVAAMVDKILAKTRQLMVDYELESRDTVKGWGEMFQHYVPLMREDDGDAPQRLGSGQGYSIKGREVKSRTGSTKKVVDVFANIAMQRERVIVRGEKNRVGQALVNLARDNENRDFWTVDLAPTTPTYDPKKGVVVQRPDPMYKMRPNVVVAKFREEDGSVKEHAVIFNEGNARAMRTAAVMKNLEMDRLEGLLGASAVVTRYFAAISTQWNPVFGVVNFIRDFQNVLINLNGTPLDGKQSQVAKEAWGMTKAIWTNLRSGKLDTERQKLWDEFQSVGAQTGFRQMFADSKDRADDIRSAINPDYWMDSKLGKVFTANGVLKVPVSKASKVVRAGFQALSDYNETLENSMRLAVYKVAKESGMSIENAASLAKNASVNFNRKGQVAQQAGALFAFYNAASAGTARLGELLFTMEPGQIKTLRLSRVGKRIVAGGVMIGVMQALALAAAGYGEDDPPQFMRERSIIIPTFDGRYVSIPMPLGLHVLPNIGRVATEWAMGGLDKTPERVVGMLGMFADAFNPIGNAGMSMQTIAPTALDPLVALTENRDWQGRPITRESMNPATPGHALARDTATSWAIAIAKGVNTLTGGNDYVAGAISPSPDQVDYLIGQLTGGVGREISKLEQTITATVTGEELPIFKVPLVGRFGGNTASQASEGSNFYGNVKRLNELETEIKGLQQDGKASEAAQLRASRPDAYLIAQANRAERDISKLRKEKSRLVKEGAPRDQVRAIEERITARMASLNRAVEALGATR